MNNGWVKLHRSFIDWEWYKDRNTKDLFIHLILRANHTDARWQGILIRRGQLITSYQHLSQELSGKESSLSVRQVRTAINKLKSTGELTCNPTNKYTVITVNNYDLYQSVDTQEVSQMTSKRQADDKQMTTNKNDKNEKNEKETNTSTVTEVTGVGIANEFKTYIQEYNGLMEKRFQPLPALLAKYKARRKTFSKQEIYDATLNLYRSPYHMGDNDRGTFYATPDFILRSDSQIDKWKDANNTKGVS